MLMPKRRTREELLEIILDERTFLCAKNNMETPCWIWKPGQWNSGNGYGKVRFNNKAMMVHRFVWETLRSLIHGNEVLDHLCRRRACCNPDHLELVTIKTNTYRGSAVLFSKTRCESEE